MKWVAVIDRPNVCHKCRKSTTENLCLLKGTVIIKVLCLECAEQVLQEGVSEAL